MSTLAWPIWAWTCWGGAAIFVVSALLFLHRGLLRDKRFKTRRCPRCWYEMTGVPGLKCPECGHEVKTERALFRRRRSRWWAAMGLVLLLFATPLCLWPKVWRDGWWTVTPTSVLIVMWPGWIPEWQKPPGQVAVPGGPVAPMYMGGTASPSLPTMSFTGAKPSAVDAVTGMFDVPRMWGWERRLLARRCAELLRDARNSRLHETALNLVFQMGPDGAPAMPTVVEMAATGEEPGRARRRMGYTTATLSNSARSFIKNVTMPKGLEIEAATHVALAAGSAGSGAAVSAERIAAAYWAEILQISPTSSIALELAHATRHDPMLLPDVAVVEMSKDPRWADDLARAVAKSLGDYREDPDRCAGVLTAIGGPARSVLARLVAIGKDGMQEFAVRRAAFEAIGGLSPVGADIQTSLEDLVRGGDDPAILLAGTALARLRGDRELLCAILVAAMEPGRQSMVSQEAADIAARESMIDRRVLEALIGASGDHSTMLRDRALAALGRLAPLSSEAEAARRFAAEHTPQRDRGR